MDQTDLRRLEHAKQTLAKGIAALPSDLKNGIYWVKSGLLLKATTLFKNQCSETEAAINELVDTVGKILEEHKQSIAPSEQNELVLLSLFAKNMASAARIAALPIEASDTYPFTLALRSHLAQVLALPCEATTTLKVSAVEAKLLKDIKAVAEKSSTDFSGTEEFWSALRKKRFANTIFEHGNIFRHALEFVRGS